MTQLQYLDHNPTLQHDIAFVETNMVQATTKKRWQGSEWCYRLKRVLLDRPESGDPCVIIPGHIVNKPDPCIYSQFLLMQLDQPVTWDNPDVHIFHNGTEQDTYNLVADTLYDIQIHVHNSSRAKPAINTNVYPLCPFSTPFPCLHAVFWKICGLLYILSEIKEPSAPHKPDGSS